MTAALTDEDRSRPRERPSGWPIMYQSWEKLLFLNWEVPVDAIRPLVPEPLLIDTFEGRAWLTITPLNIYNARPIFVPRLPFLSQMYELNVRTYVHFDRVPGVWFFSLDANSSLAVAGARTFFNLPYFGADIELNANGRSIEFQSKRTGREAAFSTKWTIGAELPEAQPGSLEYFLLERYCLYAADETAIYRGRIHHRPWPRQQPMNFGGWKSSVVRAAGLNEPSTDPLLFCGGPVDVEVWPIEKVAVNEKT